MSTKDVIHGLQNIIVRRYMGPFWHRRHWLKKTQWLSKDELLDIQLNLLKRIVRYAERYVPYYQKLMKEKRFTSDDIRSLEDIKLFPILSKQDVLEAGDAILSSIKPKCLLREAHTGGTTGVPLSVYRSLFSIGNEHAFARRQWDWAGIGFADRCGYFRGSIIGNSDSGKEALYRYDPIMKELHMSSYHLSPEQVMTYLEAIKKYRVSALAGYPSAMVFLARTCIARNKTLPLKAVFTSSEALTATMRKEIYKAFGCPVYDYYGSAERVCYIFTCEHGSYHIQPEYGYTELLPLDDSNSEYSKIVSTGFWTTAMPLIRYDTGDLVIASSGSCKCGREFDVVESIVGREGDVIISPSGEKFGVTIMIHLLYVVCGASNVLETQFIQDAPGHITVEYVPEEKFSDEDFSRAQKQFIEKMPKTFKIDFKRVKAVERTLSGKVRPVVCKL